MLTKLGLSKTNNISGKSNNTPPVTPPSTAPSLDAPIPTALLPKAYHAFGFDRMVEGYTGNTARLRRLSDNVEEDFGFNATTGIFDIAAVETWRDGADVDAVELFDQTVNGATANNDGTIAFIRNNTPYRFGCDYDEATALLTPSPINGGIGCNLGGTGAWKIDNTTIDTSNNGIELSFLSAMNTRKAKNPALDTVAGSNNATEFLFAYGTGSNNYFRHRFFGGFGTLSEYDTLTSGGYGNDIAGAVSHFPQYGQFIMSARINSSEYEATIHNTTDSYTALPATHSSDVTTGDMDNGIILIGGNFSNATGGVWTGERGNIMFGGIIITQELTPAERFMTQAKLGTIGQQHRIKSKTDIESLFDEIIYMKDVNPTDGIVAGQNSKTSYDFNEGTNAAGTSTTIFNYDDPRAGLRGINYPDQVQANGFRATNTYFSGVTTGTILSLHRTDIPSNQLAYAVCQGTQDGFSTNNSNRSLALGYDHYSPVLWTKPATPIKDLNQLTGTRKFSDGTVIGDLAGSGGANQGKGKYNRNTIHASFNYPVNIDGYPYNEQAWRNNDHAAPKQFDAPTGHDIAQNLGFPFRNDILTLHVATFEAPADYDRNAPLTAREPLFLQAKNKSYLGLTGSAIGHVVGDIAINPNAAVVDSTDDARLTSSHWFDNCEGTLIMQAFIPDVILTKEQVEEIQVNLYRLFA